MSERSQAVYHRGQLEDMLAALVRHRVLMALVVRLSQDRHDGDATGVSCQDGTTGRLEGLQPWGQGDGQLQRVEARLCLTADVAHLTTECTGVTGPLRGSTDSSSTGGRWPMKPSSRRLVN